MRTNNIKGRYLNMKDIIIAIIVLTVTNIGLHIFINHKKKKGYISGAKTDKFPTGFKFFTQGIFPTLIVIVMVADTMLDWMVIYIYTF